jgi:alkaline phosphatase
MYKTVRKTLTGPLLCSSLAILLSGCVVPKQTVMSTQSNSDPYWQTGSAELQTRLNTVRNNRGAKNVILFVADGMGISTITAARIFDGQSKGQTGEENYLSFEQFPHVALVKTYNSDSQVPDSAGTASALNTGVKTRRGAINTWADQPLNECYGPSSRFPQSIAEVAEQQGLSTGIVSTARITHATPAAVYGHSPSRGWEGDSGMSKDAIKAGCKDLAQQMVEFNKGDGLDVVLGGGRAAFLPKDNGGTRKDSRNLVSEWQQRYPSGQYVSNAAEFRAVDNTKATRLMGLFSESHMAYEYDRDKSAEPSLTEMTTHAIDILSQNNKGYYLMVESGRVDHAHHATNARRALSDAQAFSNAIKAAVEKVDLNETLILVTADHSHSFTIAGYPGRGNPILGLVHQRELMTGKLVSEPMVLDDGKPYTTLGYYIGSNERKDGHEPLTDEQVLDPDYLQQTAIKKEGGGHHGGEDVAIFAVGPKSHLVSGVIEQHTVFHIITHALGWRFDNDAQDQ